MPEKVECRYCGKLNNASLTSCAHCSASLKDAVVKIFCERCGIPLPDGVPEAGQCVTCGKQVHLCQKHLAKVHDDEIYCNEHESECFIATAVFGTPLDPKIDLLREFRDTWLTKNILGKISVRLYYEISPSIAYRARKNELLRKTLRKIIVEPALRITRSLLKT
ncbi:MAG: CFI-box-CTERM domain-containing protein [Candidatus Thorarchaeota archaeon]|jgi:hypothetical protein